MQQRESRVKVLVTLGALKPLLAWANDAIDFDEESDSHAANAFEILTSELEEGVTSFGCKHGTERGFLCQQCGKLV